MSKILIVAMLVLVGCGKEQPPVDNSTLTCGVSCAGGKVTTVNCGDVGTPVELQAGDMCPCKSGDVCYVGEPNPDKTKPVAN